MPWNDTFIPNENWTIQDWGALVGIIAIIGSSIVGTIVFFYKYIKKKRGETTFPILKFNINYQGKDSKYKTIITMCNETEKLLPKKTSLQYFQIINDEVALVDKDDEIDFFENIRLVRNPEMIFNEKNKRGFLYMEWQSSEKNTYFSYVYVYKKKDGRLLPLDERKANKKGFWDNPKKILNKALHRKPEYKWNLFFEVENDDN